MATTSEARGRGTLQMARFGIAGEEYAVDIMRIKEVINPLPIRPVPRAPAFLEGIIELRGAILPVVDLRRRLDPTAGALGRDAKYIIAPLAGRPVGLVVDRVFEVARVEAAEILPPPPTGGGGAACFAGVFRREGRIVLVVDLDRVLSADEKAELLAAAP